MVLCAPKKLKQPSRLFHAKVFFKVLKAPLTPFGVLTTSSSFSYFFFSYFSFTPFMHFFLFTSYPSFIHFFYLSLIYFLPSSQPLTTSSHHHLIPSSPTLFLITYSYHPFLSLIPITKLNLPSSKPTPYHPTQPPIIQPPIIQPPIIQTPISQPNSISSNPTPTPPAHH